MLLGQVQFSQLICLRPFMVLSQLHNEDFQQKSIWSKANKHQVQALSHHEIQFAFQPLNTSLQLMLIRNCTFLGQGCYFEHLEVSFAQSLFCIVEIVIKLNFHLDCKLQLLELKPDLNLALKTQFQFQIHIMETEVCQPLLCCKHLDQEYFFLLLELSQAFLEQVVLMELDSQQDDLQWYSFLDLESQLSFACFLKMSQIHIQEQPLL